MRDPQLDYKPVGLFVCIYSPLLSKGVMAVLCRLVATQSPDCSLPSPLHSVLGPLLEDLAPAQVSVH